MTRCKLVSGVNLRRTETSASFFFLFQTAMRSISRLVVIAGLPVLFFASASRSMAQDETAAWEKYDFIPGERIIYFEDFTAVLPASVINRLGDLTPGASLDPRQGVPFLRVTPPGGYIAALPEALPEHFTIDFDLSVDGANENGVRRRRRE